MNREILYNTGIKKKLQQDPAFVQKIAVYKIKEIYKDELFSNSAPSVFVGSRLQYPAVHVGILSPPEKKENVWLYDAQRYWAHHNFNIQNVLDLRRSLINSRFKTELTAVRKDDNKFLQLAREIGMSSQPVDTEMKLKKKIKIHLTFDDVALPSGPLGQLQSLTIGNTKIPAPIDKVYSDHDMKATEAISYLHKREYDEQKLSQLLSIGILGVKKNRVLVPTRSSITAIDDTLGKSLLKNIRNYLWIQDYCLYAGNYLGNYYFVLMMPDLMQYELFETYLPGSFWNSSMNIEMAHDYETFRGRTTYAINCAGGYYASRLPVCEFLHHIKRQASVLVIRFETPEYSTGLGVWVVREAMRKTLQTKPFVFASHEELLKKTQDIIYQQFQFDSASVFEKSMIIETRKKQRKLQDFIV